MSDHPSSGAAMPALADDKGSTAYLYMISAVAAVGGLLFGFDTAIIAGAGEFVKAEFHLDVHQEGFAVSSLLIGCMVGAAVAGFTSDRLGRKKVLIATSAFYVGSALCSALPQSLSQLVAARFLGGLAVGVSSMVAPLYIAELAPARIRGRLVSLNQMAIVTGILMADVVSWLLEGVGHNNWRWMFASAALPAFMLFIALLFVPESPRWLAKAGLPDQALAILTTIGGRRHAQTEMAEIESALTEETGSLLELFGPGLRIALVIGLGLAVLGQITGINTIIYYAPKIFMATGCEQTSTAMWASVLVGITNFISTLVALWLIDRVGRKRLLLFGSAGMGIALVLAGAFLASERVPHAAKVAIILVYIVSFAIGLGGTVWVVISEIFPTKIRGRAVSLAVVGVWAACFVIAQTFPYLFDAYYYRSFWIYAVMCAIMFVFVWLLVPETKGESLEGIERMWKRRTRAIN